MATQTFIPGTEPPRIQELDDLALEYRKKRDERQRLLQEEIELKGKLLEKMHEHELTVYPIQDTDVEVALEHGKENVKVRKRKKAGDDDGELAE